MKAGLPRLDYCYKQRLLLELYHVPICLEPCVTVLVKYNYIMR